MTASDSVCAPARRCGRIAAGRAGATVATVAAALLAGALLAGGAVAQSGGHGHRGGPFGTAGGADPGEWQRQRQELREQLRGERMRPPGAPAVEPHAPAGRDRLSPEERQALRRQLREQMPQPPGRPPGAPP